MAHAAEIENNIVIRVAVIDDAHEGDIESWCADFFGGTWKQTSYNGNMRKQFAGVGYTYDEINDVFVSPQPFPSWTLDSNHDWRPPTARPDGPGWVWDEDTLAWINRDG